jgi:hypothetical protein
MVVVWGFHKRHDQIFNGVVAGVPLDLLQKSIRLEMRMDILVAAWQAG